MFRKIADNKQTSYLKSLNNNPYWERVKRAVRLRENYKCQHCQTIGRHEVHHKRYVVNGVSIVGRELQHLDELELLCGECHKATHKKASQVSKRTCC